VLKLLLKKSIDILIFTLFICTYATLSSSSGYYLYEVYKVYSALMRRRKIRTKW